jgi:MFS family permease
MPLLVAQLNVPATEFGLVISAFGLSKLLGNIPSGYLVERYGRKPVLVAGLGMCGVGLGAIGTYYTAYCILHTTTVLLMQFYHHHFFCIYH